MRAAIFAGIILLWSCSKPAEIISVQPGFVEVSFESFPVNSSIRALEVVDANRIFYAGSNSKFGYTLDGGVTWVHDSLDSEAGPLEIRAISVSEDNIIHLLNAGSPAFLFRSEDLGKSWEKVYSEEGDAVFYDAMTFWDEGEGDGIAMGDPVGPCISVIITRDGGRTWLKVSCDDLPMVD